MRKGKNSCSRSETCNKALFYNVQIVLRRREEDPIDLKLAPILIAASVISENERTTIEQGLSTAMINVMDSIEAQYTILVQTK
jgi:hypothetical protein